MELKEWVDEHKVLTPIIFWGGLIFITLALMAWRDDEPNWEVLEYQDKIYQETYPQYPWTQ